MGVLMKSIWPSQLNCSKLLWKAKIYKVRIINYVNRNSKNIFSKGCNVHRDPAVKDWLDTQKYDMESDGNMEKNWQTWLVTPGGITTQAFSSSEGILLYPKGRGTPQRAESHHLCSNCPRPTPASLTWMLHQLPHGFLLAPRPSQGLFSAAARGIDLNSGQIVLLVCSQPIANILSFPE